MIVPSQHSYYAIRLCPRDDAAEWWAAAQRARSSATPQLRAILRGRRRIEVSAAEVSAALRWARGIEGWDEDRVAPIVVHPRAPDDGTRSQ